jgi:AcrR family transcriptional regulator
MPTDATDAAASDAATDTAERLLDAASSLFAERGYAATTTRAIAERAGVNEVTVFRRFGTKAGLLAGIGERLAAGSAGVAVHDLPTDPRAALHTLARVEVASALRHGTLALRLALDARSVPEVAHILGTGSGDNAAGLADWIGQCQRRGELRTDLPAPVLAEAFFALTSSLVLGRQLMGRPVPQGRDLERLVDQMVGLFWTGARPTSGEELE